MKRKSYTAPDAVFAELTVQNVIMASMDNDGSYKSEWEDFL